MCWQDQALLSHPCFTSNIWENDVSSKIAFVQGFDDEPGSNVMSFSHHVMNLSIRHPESIWIWLSGWWHNRQDELVALLLRWAIFKVWLNFMTFLFCDTLIIVLLQKELLVVNFTGEQSLPTVLVTWLGISISKSVMLAHVGF